MPSLHCCEAMDGLQLTSLLSLWRCPWKAFLRLSSSTVELKKFSPGLKMTKKALFFQGRLARKFGAFFASFCHTFCFLQPSRRFACGPEVRGVYLLLCWPAAGFLVQDFFDFYCRSWFCYRPVGCICWPLWCDGRSCIIPYWFLWLEPAAQAVPASNAISSAVWDIFIGPCDLWE